MVTVNIFHCFATIFSFTQTKSNKKIEIGFGHEQTGRVEKGMDYVQ